jgi:hypothetical protein
MTPGAAGTCSIAQTTSLLGSVTEQIKGMTVTDGASAAIACSVVPGSGGAFDVQASGEDESGTGGTMIMQVPGIAAGATKASPVTGMFAFLSPATGDNEYVSEACEFYFGSPDEGVGAGRIWVTFDCPAVTDGPAMSTCGIGTSVAIFEGCAAE